MIYPHFHYVHICIPYMYWCNIYRVCTQIATNMDAHDFCCMTHIHIIVVLPIANLLDHHDCIMSYSCLVSVFVFHSSHLSPHFWKLKSLSPLFHASPFSFFILKSPHFSAKTSDLLFQISQTKYGNAFFPFLGLQTNKRRTQSSTWGGDMPLKHKIILYMHYMCKNP